MKKTDLETIEIDDEQETAGIEQALAQKEERERMMRKIGLKASNGLYRLCGKRRLSPEEEEQRMTGRYPTFGVEYHPSWNDEFTAPRARDVYKGGRARLSNGTSGNGKANGKFIIIEKDERVFMRCYIEPNPALRFLINPRYVPTKQDEFEAMAEDIKMRTGLEGQILGGGEFTYEAVDHGDFNIEGVPNRHYSLRSAPEEALERAVAGAMKQPEYSMLTFHIKGKRIDNSYLAICLAEKKQRIARINAEASERAKAEWAAHNIYELEPSLSRYVEKKNGWR